jgi:hypothetical protein
MPVQLLSAAQFPHVSTEFTALNPSQRFLDSELI